MHRADHILIADDDADFVLLLRTAFEYAGFNGMFGVAADGLQAIQYLQRKGFDACESLESRPCVALLDLALPRLPEAAVLKWIRQQPDLAQLPVILMLGVEAGTEAQLAAELGANDLACQAVRIQQVN